MRARAVAEEDGHGIAPPPADGPHSPSAFRLVDHVVMDEGRHVYQFGGDGEVNVSVGEAADGRAGEKGGRGPQSLPPASDGEPLEIGDGPAR